MSKFWKCSKHNIDYDVGDKACDCEDGFRLNDDYGFEEWRICWKCKGDGEVEVPVCHLCNDEYNEYL